MVQNKARYGNDLTDDELPAQAYFEDFQERLAAGMLRAEPLDQVISQAEAEEQDRMKPEPARQYGIHLDSRLTLQTRRKCTSSNPKDIEELRAKYDVMSNLWLLAQMRQPGRVLYADLSPNTFPRMLKELLNKKNFNLKKELLDDKNVVAPPWNHCLTYEYELRKEACRIGQRDSYWHSARRGGQRATQASTGCSTGYSWSVWPTHHHPLHRQTLRNWRDSREKLQNSGKIVLGRRGSQIVVVVLAHFPTVNSQPCQPQPLQHQHLSPSRAAEVAEAKVVGKEAKRPSTRPRHGSSGILIRGPREIKDMFHGGRDNSVCYNFQEHLCTEGAQCKRQHCCIGCGGSQAIQRVPLPPTKNPKLALRSVIAAY